MSEVLEKLLVAQVVNKFVFLEFQSSFPCLQYAVHWILSWTPHASTSRSLSTLYFLFTKRSLPVFFSDGKLRRISYPSRVSHIQRTFHPPLVYRYINVELQITDWPLIAEQFIVVRRRAQPDPTQSIIPLSGADHRLTSRNWSVWDQRSWLALLLFNPEVPVSILSPQADSHDWIFQWFPSARA